VATEWSGPSAAEYAAAADEFITKLVDGGFFNGAVLVARDGEVLFSRGYGFADRESETPITPQTRFRLGGLNAQFTAMAILILQDQGKLDVQDPVCTYLPDCPAAWESLTIHHVLSHSSGLDTYLARLAEGRRLATPLPPEDVIALISDLPLRYPPGEKTDGSWGSEPFLLAQIVERASGTTYDDFVQESIYTPLGMDDSGPAGETDEDLAIAYASSSTYLAPAIDDSVVHGFASHWSTVEDLLRWDQALYTEKLVPQAVLDQMFTTHGTFRGESVDFAKQHGLSGAAYFWFVGEQFGRRDFLYWGGTPGSWDYIDRYPDDQVTIIMLINQENVDPWIAGTKLAELLFEPE
jgi:CubicO group peptidase (beta-lactamase class C family)